MSRRRRSKSGVVGAGIALLGALLILAACFGLKPIGDDRNADSLRSAAGSSTSLTTTVTLEVRNSLPVAIVVTASDVGGGWSIAPNADAAFASRSLAAGGSHRADLAFSTSRSRVPFTLSIADANGNSLGSVDLDRDHLRETCTTIKQGSYEIKDCSQVNIWWLADSRVLGTSSSCPYSNNAVDLGDHTDAQGTKQRVKATLTCSSTTGATTVTLTQSASPAK